MIEGKVARLEADMIAVRKDVKDILEHKIPDLSVEIVSLKTSMKIYGGLIIAGISALIVMGLT